MNYSRADLFRLVADMPIEAVPTMCRVILWICPGMVEKGQPICGQHQIAILEGLDAIHNDPALKAELKRLIAAERQPPKPRDNVVSLFQHHRRRPSDPGSPAA